MNGKLERFKREKYIAQKSYVNGWLRFTVIFTVIMLVAGIVGVIAVKSSYVSTGIENVHTLDDLRKLDIILNCSMVASGTETELKIYNHYEEKASMYIDQLDTADAICVVVATGNVEFLRGSYYQEVIVKNVLKDTSANLKAQDVIKIFDYENLAVVNGVITYKDSTNLINPANEYLVFVKGSELNELGNKKHYELIDNPFSCVCINSELKQHVCVNNRFWENWGINEFFNSQKLLDQFLAIEDRVIRRYCVVE